MLPIDFEQALKSQDIHQFQLLYEHFCDRVYAILLRILGNEQDAESLMQKVFVRIWQKANSFDNQHGSLLSWILGIAAREALHFKSKR